MILLLLLLLSFCQMLKKNVIVLAISLDDLGPFLQRSVEVSGHLIGKILLKSVINRLALINT